MNKKIKDDSDDFFLFDLFLKNKKLELGWQDADPVLIEPILHIQWNARNQHYTQHYPLAKCYIFSLHDNSVGQLTVQHEQHCIHIIDISILPDYHNQGIGTLIIQDLQNIATQSNLSITLNVSTSNSAYFLYKKLGFFDIQQDEIEIKMKWN